MKSSLFAIVRIEVSTQSAGAGRWRPALVVSEAKGRQLIVTMIVTKLHIRRRADEET